MEPALRLFQRAGTIANPDVGRAGYTRHGFCRRCRDNGGWEWLALRRPPLRCHASLEGAQRRANSQAMRWKPHEYWLSDNSMPRDKQGGALRAIGYLRPQRTRATANQWPAAQRSAVQVMGGAQHNRKPIRSKRKPGSDPVRSAQRQPSRPSRHDPPRSTRGPIDSPFCS